MGERKEPYKEEQNEPEPNKNKKRRKKNGRSNMLKVPNKHKCVYE